MIPTGIPLKSNPLIATHTCTSTLDTLTRTWHSTQARLLHRPWSWSGWLLWASFTSSRVRRKHLDYYFFFSFLYSLGSHVSYKWSFQSCPRNVRKPRQEIKHALVNFCLHIKWCCDDAMATNKNSLDMEVEFYSNLLELFHQSDEEPKWWLFGKARVICDWVNLRHVKFKADQWKFWLVANAKWSMDVSDLPAPHWLVHSWPWPNATNDPAHARTPSVGK